MLDDSALVVICVGPMVDPEPELFAECFGACARHLNLQGGKVVWLLGWGIWKRGTLWRCSKDEFCFGPQQTLTSTSCISWYTLHREKFAWIIPHSTQKYQRRNIEQASQASVMVYGFLKSTVGNRLYQRKAQQSLFRSAVVLKHTPSLSLDAAWV